MKYWTVQSQDVFDIIEKNGIYYPDFRKSRYALENKENMEFYQWLLNSYNAVNNVKMTGLLFVFAERNQE